MEYVHCAMFFLYIKCDLATYPCGHAVGVWVAVVVVKDHHGEEDAARHHPHDEVEVRSCETTALVNGQLIQVY